MKKIISLALFMSLLVFCNLANAERLGILNGNAVTNDNLFPFVLALYQGSDTNAGCTATLIAPQWVLTASHCVYDFEHNRIYAPSQLSIGTGYKAAQKNAAEELRAVSSITVYDNKKTIAKDHDVALLKLQDPITTIKPIAITASLGNLKSGTQQIVDVGYGWTTITNWAPICKTDPNSDQCTWEEPAIYNDYYGSFVVDTDAQTEALIKKYFYPKHFPMTYDPDTMIGITSAQGNHLTNGDSGGPVLVRINDQYQQVGVNSWGSNFNYTTFTDGDYAKSPSICVNLTNPDIYKFIEQTIKSDSKHQ